MNRPLGLALIFHLALLATPAHAFREAEVQQRYCAGMPIDQHLTDGSEVDCVLPGADGPLAVEVDFSDHWAQAIGQSLHYARITETRPAVILVCNEGVRTSTCERHLSRMLDTLEYWRIGMFVWFCRSERDATLDECRFIDLYEVMQ